MTKSDITQLELTAQEVAELRDLEDRIASAVRAIESNWRDLAQCLATIREKRLYRQSHSSFEAYCRERHGQSARRINQLIAGNTVLENLRTRVPTLPKTEKQVRPLAQLPVGEQAEAWKAAQEKSGTDQPPASVVKRVVVERKKEQPTMPPWQIGDVVCVQEEEEKNLCKVLRVGFNLTQLQDSSGHKFCIENQFITQVDTLPLDDLDVDIPIRVRSLVKWKQKYYWVTKLFGTDDRCQIAETSPPSGGIKFDTYEEDCCKTQLCAFQSQLKSVVVPLVGGDRPLATTTLTVWGKPRRIVGNVFAVCVEWELTDGRGMQTTQVPIDRVDYDTQHQR